MDKHKLRELDNRIDEVLYYLWDPIGVSDTPAARSEYSSYTMSILKYVLEEDKNKVANVLSRIETDSMGINKNEEKNLAIAELLIEYKYAVEEGLK